jgi:hypothetical protein
MQTAPNGPRRELHFQKYVHTFARTTGWLLATGVFVFLSVGHAQDLPSDGVKDILTSVDCLNGEKPNQMSKSVPCIPQGCKITNTMSARSAQKACRFPDDNLAGLHAQLAHVILNCPGAAPGVRLRPSYLLCTRRGWPGFQDLEFGEDVVAAVKMMGANVVIPFGDDLGEAASARYLR